MNDLKCCPFCGGEAEVGLTNQHDKLFVVGCNTPMCYGNINHFTMVFVSKESALNTWNTRAPMANIVEKLEEMKKDSSQGCEKVNQELCNSYLDCGLCLIDRIINIVKGA